MVLSYVCSIKTDRTETKNNPSAGIVLLVSYKQAVASKGSSSHVPDDSESCTKAASTIRPSGPSMYTRTLAIPLPDEVIVVRTLTPGASDNAQDPNKMVRTDIASTQTLLLLFIPYSASMATSLFVLRFSS